MATPISIVSYNCRGFHNAADDICKLINTNDIVLLQETWIPLQEIHRISALGNFYDFTAVSPVDLSEGPLIGRPYGGVAILWKKTLSSCISTLNFDDDRLSAVTLRDNLGNIHLLINIYMPYQCSENVDLYLEVLGRICSLLDSNDWNYLYLAGDFNASPGSKFYEMLCDFCTDHDLKIRDIEFFRSLSMRGEDVFTYVSDAHSSTSWLDHVICSNNATCNVNDFSILQDHLSSDHLPVKFSLDVSLCNNLFNVTNVPSEPDTNRNSLGSIKWKGLTNQQISRYHENLMQSLPEIEKLNLRCADNCKSCSIPDHISTIDKYVDQIIHCTRQSAAFLTSHKASKASKREQPGWNRYLKDLYAKSRDAFALWVRAGRPSSGLVNNLRKSKRKEFKNALKESRLYKERILSDEVARLHLQKKVKPFWRNVNRMKSCRSSLPSQINNASTPDSICDLWKTHYQKIFNSVPNSNVIDFLRDNTAIKNFEFSPIRLNEVYNAVRNLKFDKAQGLDDLPAECFIFGSNELLVHLTELFNTCITHSHFPNVMSNTYITPVIKDKRGAANEMKNYRPIAVASALCKIFESVLRSRILPFVKSCDNQLSFKCKVGTETCVFLLKEIIRTYTKKSTPVHCAFLDASKAFDRINHIKLFNKLLLRGVPNYLIAILANWYSTSRLLVRWGSSLSHDFNASNGVRQGSLLSPILFALYIDDLSFLLKKERIGCCVGSEIVNHIFYADDLVLISPSVLGLRKLVTVCESYARSHDMIFNESKSVCVRFSRKDLNYEPGYIRLNDCNLVWRNSVKYLGVIITSNLDDRIEIASHTRSFYARSNSIYRTYKDCSIEVKLLLFESFCLSFYLFHLWFEYPLVIFNRLRVATNNMLRKLVGLPKYCSASEMHVYLRLENIDARLRKMRANFYQRICTTDNSLVRNFVYSLDFLTCPLYDKIMEQTTVL